MSELDFLHYSFDGAFTPFNLGEIPSKGRLLLPNGRAVLRQQETF